MRQEKGGGACNTGLQIGIEPVSLFVYLTSVCGTDTKLSLWFRYVSCTAFVLVTTFTPDFHGQH